MQKKKTPKKDKEENCLVWKERLHFAVFAAVLEKKNHFGETRTKKKGDEVVLILLKEEETCVC